MNNFSCSLSCTWMTIIDCQFYASDSLSRDVSWEYIAKLRGINFSTNENLDYSYKVCMQFVEMI